MARKVRRALSAGNQKGKAATKAKPKAERATRKSSGKGTKAQEASSRPSRATMPKKSVRAPAKKVATQKGGRAKLAARQKKPVEPTKGARSVKVMMAKAQNQDLMGKTAVAKGRKFQQDVLREIDRLRAEEKAEKQKKPAKPVSGIVTRRTRQTILAGKRGVEAVPEDNKTTKVKKEDKTTKVKKDDKMTKVKKDDKTTEVKKDAVPETETEAEASTDTDTVYQVGSSVLETFIKKLKTANKEDLPGILHVVKNEMCRYSSDTDWKGKVNNFVKFGGVPTVAQIVKDSSSRDLLFDATWILINVTAGTSKQTNLVFDEGIVPKLLELMEGTDEDVQEHALWILDNMTGDGPKLRNKILEAGLVKPLERVLETSTVAKVLSEAILIIKNLCEKPPPSDHDIVFNLTKPLKKHLAATCESRSGFLKVICWTLTSIASAYAGGPPNPWFDSDFNSIAHNLMRLVKKADPVVAEKAMGCMLAFSAQSHFQPSDHLINAEFVMEVPSLLKLDRSRLFKRDVLHTLSNIAAGQHQQVMHILDHNIIPQLLPVLCNGDDWLIKNLLYTINNAFACNHAYNNELIEKTLIEHQDFFKSLSAVLVTSDSTILDLATDVLLKALRLCKKDCGYVEKMRSCGGTTHLESLRVLQQSPEINARICLILDDFLTPAV